MQKKRLALAFHFPTVSARIHRHPTSRGHRRHPTSHGHRHCGRPTPHGHRWRPTPGHRHCPKSPAPSSCLTGPLLSLAITSWSLPPLPLLPRRLPFISISRCLFFVNCASLLLTLSKRALVRFTYPHPLMAHPGIGRAGAFNIEPPVVNHGGGVAAAVEEDGEGEGGLGEDEVGDEDFDFNTGGGERYESGSEEEQAAFMRALARFFRERLMEFKPPKFYGEGLNCLKLWRSVIRLGGYDQVTYCKLWRSVGEAFKPPKTCTTVSWTFRGFYEKALLDYERHKVQIGEIIVAANPLADPAGKNQGPVKSLISGRARRDAAARAMQGWHSQQVLGNGEVGDPIIKDKNSALVKREKQLKNLSPLKRKKPFSIDHGVKIARSKGSHPRDGQIASPGPKSETTIIDIGPAADWVKINVHRTRDCFEVYALVPGLMREQVRVQSDPAGRLVISGEPEQHDNPWGVTPFKKIVSLPSRIDPNQTSAVVTLHGQLFVRAPFEQLSC